MKVSDSPTANLEYTKSLDEKLRNTSKAKEQEIERIKNLYDKKVQIARANGDDRYEATIKQSENRVIAASADYEEKLKNYSDSLSKTEKNIAQNEQLYKEQHDGKIRDLKEQSANNIEDEIYRANETQRDVTDSMTSSVRNLKNKSERQKKQMEAQAHAHVNAIESNFNQKISLEDRDFRTKLDAEVHAHEESLRLQKNEFKAELDKNMERGKQVEMEKKKVQKDELSFLDNHQRDMIAQKNSDFKVRYDNMVKEHESILDELKSHLDSDMKKMIESTIIQKKNVESKLNDNFYRIETLNPAITETEKDLIVSLKVPEYEKENVHLSAHGRDLKITLNRRFADSMDAADGSSNKSTRNELFSKEFSTKDILNPKLISQKYDKGVLTFKIAKA